VAGFLAALLIIVNAFLVYEHKDKRDTIIRCYIILFSFFIIIIEMNIRSLIAFILVTESWFVRGLLYSFLGIVTTSKDAPSRLSPENLAGYAMFVVGVMYIFMSLLCLKRVKDKRIETLLALKSAAAAAAAVAVV